MSRTWANNGITTLDANISDTATTATVVNGAVFGSPSASNEMTAVIRQGATRELVHITNVSGNTLTLVRAREGTTAQAFTSGATIANVITKQFTDEVDGLVSAVGAGILPTSLANIRTAQGGATGVNTIGQAATTSGTITARTSAGTSLFASRNRQGMVSAASAAAVTRITMANQLFNTATPANGDAVAMWVAFGISDAVFSADAGMFVGFHSFNGDLGALSTSDEFVGIVCNPGDSNFSLTSNNGTAPITTTTLGANFPANTTGVDWYEFSLWKPAGVAGWRYRLLRVNTGHVAAGVLTSDIPDMDGALHAHIQRRTGAGTAAVAFDYTVFATGRPFSV
jgi:hypothetical protein